MSTNGTCTIQEIRALVKGTNINEETLLATDYLNHFNEVIMLIGLVPTIPECLEEAKTWRPRSYVEHFRQSVFSDRDLAVLAYENAPAAFRVPFDETVHEINTRLAECLAEIETLQASEDAELLNLAVVNWTDQIGLLMDRASAIINGDFGKGEENTSITLDQDDIDALFD